MTGGNNADTRIKTILTADSGDFEAGVQRATKALEQAEGKFRTSNKRTESSFMSLGKAAQGLAVYFSVRAVVNYGQQVLHLADQLKTLEERTGVSAQFFSALQPEIENAGGSLDSFGSSLNKMSIKLAKASSGNKDASRAFAAIGLSVNELTKLSPEQQFLKIATAISQLGTKGQQAAAATAIFGKGVVSLLPTLAKGGDELQRFVDEQVRLGLAMSAETVQYLDDLGDSINTLGIKAMNFSGESLVKFLKFLDRKLLTGIAENLILIGSAVGAIDKDVANEAFKVAQERYTGTGDYAPKKTEGSNTGLAELLDADGMGKAEENAKKLSDALGKLQRQTSRDIYTSGMTDLDEKLKQVDFSVADLARSFETKLTPQMQKQVDTIKDNVRVFDDLQKQEKAAEKLAIDLGGAFSDAFEDGVLGAEKFSDVLGSLGKQIEKVLFNQLVTSPLNEFFGGFAKDLFKGGKGKSGSSAGIGSFFSDIYDALPSFSFATGVKNVPYDMDARIHKGESVMSAQETRSMGSGDDRITVNVVNNAGASVKTSTKQSDSGTELLIMVDQAVAANIANKGTQTSQALAARDQRGLTRR